MIADVTVSSVQPVDPPPGFGYNRVGIPVKSFPNSAVVRADVAIHAIRVPNPYQMPTDFTFDGVTPFGDAYKSRASDAPDALDAALANAPSGLDRSRRRVLGGLPRSGLHRRAAGQEDGLSPGAVEPVAAESLLAVRVATADSVDIAELAASPHAPFRWPVPRRSPARTSRRSSRPTCPTCASPSIWPIRDG